MYEIILDNTRLNPKLAIAKSKQLLSLGRERKSLDTIAVSYLYLAKAGRIIGTYKVALEYAELGLKFAKTNNLSNTILAELYLAKANNLSHSGNNDKALPTIFLRAGLAKKSENLPIKTLLNYELGYILWASERDKEAVKTLKENIAFIEENQLLDKKNFEVYYKGMLLLPQIYTENKKSLISLMQEKKLNDLELEKEQQKSNAQYLIIGGSILILLLLFYIIKLCICNVV